MNFITRVEAETIKLSWKNLMIRSPYFGDDFYATVFSLNHNARKMFKNDIHTQSVQFIKCMTHFINGIENWETVTSEIQSLGKRHIDEYHIKEEYFEIFERAFFSTLERALNGEWTPENKTTWTNFYKLLMDIMFYWRSGMIKTEGPNTD